MTTKAAKIALYYDDSGYVETLKRPGDARADRPLGLMGRQVAGKEFLDAYLNYGDWSELVALAPNEASGRSLLETCRTHPSSRDRQRRLRLFETKEFLAKFLSDPQAQVLHFPCPPDARFLWARQHVAAPGYALCGVTHTLCSLHAVEALRTMVTAPFEPFDRMICTSRAVVDMVRAVTETYADYLRERQGGQPRMRAGVEKIPLGVEVDKFRPAIPQQRAAERRRLQIADDEIAVLFVGRLAHHAKAHPFPMFRGLALAAERTQQKVHLLLSGWASGRAVVDAFQEGARRFADNVRVSIVDGTSPENRPAVWRAADIFTSLSDNIQETFGLVIVEAMASGLPVVASDWNGYRDLVEDGETGFLIPTWMVRDATADSTVRLLVGELDYDHFLASTNQCVTVDVAAAADAYARLLADGELRRRMGVAGRRRAEKHFAWEKVIRAYEQLWAQQEVERADFVARARGPKKTFPGPAAYPAPEHSFAGYPSGWLESGDKVTADADAASRLATILELPLTNYEADRRCDDRDVLLATLRVASEACTFADLERHLIQAGVTRTTAQATLAWMLKYDLLRRAT